MSISGIVISLRPSAIMNDSMQSPNDGQQIDQPIDALEQCLEALLKNEKIEVGQRLGLHLPCVLDTSSTGEDRDLIDWIQALPAVEQVQIAFVAVDSPEECSANTSNQSKISPLRNPVLKQSMQEESHV